MVTLSQDHVSSFLMNSCHVFNASFHVHYTGFPVPKISACRRPLGDQIRNDSITVSSQKSPIDGRVNVGLGSNRRSWIPQKSDKNQWLQVDLGNKMQITGIATQGHHNGSFWVKRYSLQHSNNGVSFESYAPERQPKVNS